MQTASQQHDKINAICATLPDWATGFFWETGTQMAVSTRLAYAREISVFFDFLTTYKPDLVDVPKNEITLEQIAQVTSQDISRYITKYHEKGNKERALARKRATLSSFFRYLTVNRKIPFNPVEAATRVKIPTSDDVLHLDINEQLSLLDAVDTGDTLTKEQQKRHEIYRLRDIALITLLLDTGMRVSELHNIDIIDMDLEDCYVVVTRKGGNTQTIYFADSTRDAIEEYINERRKWDEQADGKYPLFTTTKGERLSIRAIQVLVKKYAESTLPGKGKKISPHKLRSSFAMEFYSEEKDILALQRKLGHKNLQATNIYAKATDQRMRETRSVIEKAKAEAKGEKDKKTKEMIKKNSE